MMCWRSNRQSGSPSQKIWSRPYFYFRFGLWSPRDALFWPYSGLYCHHIAHRRLEMLSIRKPSAPNLNLWPGSTVQKPEVLTKVPKVVQNVVKFTVIQKNACKTSSRSNMKWICKTGSSSVLWPTFGQIESRCR